MELREGCRGLFGLSIVKLDSGIAGTVVGGARFTFRRDFLLVIGKELYYCLEVFSPSDLANAFSCNFEHSAVLISPLPGDNGSCPWDLLQMYVLGSFSASTPHATELMAQRMRLMSDTNSLVASPSLPTILGPIAGQLIGIRKCNTMILQK